MGFRQTYKGIFQFNDRASLETAMAETQAEAMEADAMGLQDTYHGEGVMLLNLDTQGNEQDWEEMAVAMATLAMHASKGFLYAVGFNGAEPSAEYYEANADGLVPAASNSDAAPDAADDYFPLEVGATYQYEGAMDGDAFATSWSVGTEVAGGNTFYFFENPDGGLVHYNDFWDGAYFMKDRSQIKAVFAGNSGELEGLNVSDPYAVQTVYSNLAKAGEAFYAIWKQSDHFNVYVVEGFETVETPAGTFENCMKVRVEMYHVTQDRLDFETQTHYFAKGTGLVRWEKGDDHLVLTAYHAG